MAPGQKGPKDCHRCSPPGYCNAPAGLAGARLPRRHRSQEPIAQLDPFSQRHRRNAQFVGKKVYGNRVRVSSQEAGKNLGPGLECRFGNWS